jgi:N-formylglutamate deformylase
VNVFSVIQGNSPVVLAQPHGGTYIPKEIAIHLNEGGARLSDTDWHITRLYDGLLKGATEVKCMVHRYVIDANRDPENTSLYPGQNTTSLCPSTDFDGQDIWEKGAQPSADEMAARRLSFHAPYHAALEKELERVKKIHGVAILFDCHSIRSNIPFLFDGTLPVFNIGTHSGSSCHSSVEEAAINVVARSGEYDFALNGRFKGGWTIRHYGRPNTGVHAIQLELAQRAYMHEAPPWKWQDEQAVQIRVYLKAILGELDMLGHSGVLI